MTRYWVGILACGVALVGTGPAPSDRGKRNHGFLSHGHRFAVIAHRGNHVEAPENSLDAIKEAIRVGADYTELDLRTTHDGEIVMMHDNTVDRTTDGHGRVQDLTLAQIRALHFKRARNPDEKVPTFDEVLDVVKGKIRIYMDIKAVTPLQVLRYLRRHGMTRDVIAYLYGPSHVDQWRKDAPHIPIIADLNSIKEPQQVEADWKPHPFRISDGSALDYRLEIVQKFHSLNVLVWPDIQNPLEGPGQWQPVIDLDVDGLQTDHPEALIKYLEEQHIR